MDVAAVFPVPTSVEQIGTLRIAVIDGDPMLDGLVASASIVTEFEDQYLAELTAAVEDSLRSIRQLVVERLRARATIVKPIAASGFRMWGSGDSEAFLPFDASMRKREFANPWHDEIGRFAPKGTGRRVGPGWGTDRKVTIEKLPRGHKHSVTTANGDVIELHDIGDVMSSRRPLMGSADGEQVISDLLNGAADAHELSPGMKPPKIVVKKVEELIADMAALTGTSRDDWQRLYTVSAFVTSTPDEGDNPAPGWIFVNPDWIGAESFRPDSEMPAMLELGPARFKVMHEYGHLRAAAGIDDPSRLRPLYLELGAGHMPGMSGYGRTSSIEAHAEAFAEWAARGGGVIPSVGDYADTIAAYADEFGWGEEQDEALAAAGTPRPDLPRVIADSPDGPIYIWPDGTIEEIALVASAGEFANPWHDEIGRFAPKGTGTKAGIPSEAKLKSVNDETDLLLPDERGPRQGRLGGNERTKTLPPANLTLDEVEAIDDYRGTGAIINGNLRKPPLRPLVKPVVEALDSAFEHSPGFTEDTVVWRLIPANLNEHPKGPGWGDPASFIDQGYTGTTLNRQQLASIAQMLGYDRTHVEVKVIVPKGTPGLRVSHAGFQDEILLPRGGRMVPTGLDEWTFEYDPEDVAADTRLAAAVSSIAEFDDRYGDLRRFVFDADEVQLLPLVASARRIEFANPWHDEIGRFAPKGTGVKRLGPKTLNDNPDAYEPVDLEDQDAIRASLELWATDMERELSDLIMGDVEVVIDKVKSYDSGEVGLDFTIRAEGEDIGKMQRQLEPSPNARSEGWRGYAASLFIDEEMRGMGIGTVLQEGFENWAASQGIAAMGVFATMVGRYSWMRAGYDWADAEPFHAIAGMLGRHTPAGKAFMDAHNANTVTEDVPTPYELTKMLDRNQILSREFPEWDGVKPLRARELALAAAGPPSRDARLEPVRRAYRIWARQFPAAAEGDIVDPEAEAAWDALMADPDMLMLDDGLVAAGPFDLSDFNVMTVEEWATAFAVEAADIVGDVVVDSATGQALRPGLNVTDQVITDLMERHIGRLQDLGPVVQASLRDALELAIRNQLTLDEVVREIQATGPLGETAARAIARTELTAATNGGMLTGWRRDGFPFKQWRALHDGRTRHAHLDAHGQTVPTEQEFEVGGYRAQYPGDPRLPIHLRINCRCYMDRVGEGGNTITTRLADATRAQLYRLAQELNIPGRSKMRKDDLFQAIDRYRNGFGYTSLEEMNRAQLLIRARAAGIVGRSRMSKPELMIRLRDLATGRNRDRWLIDAGHGTREQLDAVRAQLREDLRSLIEGPILAAGPPPTIEKIETIRRKVFRRYGGADTGTAMCVGCGARLHWSNATRWEQMTLLRIEPKHAWSSKNAYPVCLADAAKLASLDSDKLAATFTIDNSWAAITNQFTTSWDEIVVRFATVEFANPWHDEEGKFAPKGTGTKYDAASVKGRVGAAVKAGSMVDRVGDPQATLETLDAWADKMGPEFDADEGVGMARSALSDVETGSKALIAKTKNGIAGIISYDYDPDSKMYMIHHLGTTGIAKGVGTQLAAQVMVQAASNGAGVEFEAAQNDTAPDFWSSLGFDVTNPGHVVMSASDVGAWMRDFTS